MQVARTNELLRMDDSGGGGAPPFLMTLDDTATDVFLHLLLPGGAPFAHSLCAWSYAVGVIILADVRFRFNCRQQPQKRPAHATHRA